MSGTWDSVLFCGSWPYCHRRPLSSDDWDLVLTWCVYHRKVAGRWATREIYSAVERTPSVKSSYYHRNLRFSSNLRQLMIFPASNDLQRVLGFCLSLQCVSQKQFLITDDVLAIDNIGANYHKVAFLYNGRQWFRHYLIHFSGKTEWSIFLEQPLCASMFHHSCIKYIGLLRATTLI